MDPFLAGKLPVELVELIFHHAASALEALELKRFLHLRLVSKAFDAYTINAIITTGIINETDLIKCRDKDLILRYLNWRIQHDADHESIPHEGITDAISAVKLFVVKANGRYDFDTALKMYLNVLTDQFMIRSVYYWTSETSRLLWGIPVPPLKYSDTESEADGNFDPEAPPKAPPKAQIDRDEMACLSLACAFGDLEVVNQILENDGVTLDGEKRLFPLGHPLQAAVRHGQQDAVRLLLNRGSELQRRDAIEANFNVLEDAILSNRLEMLRMFLGLAKQTKHFKHMCEWAFCMACYCGDVEAFKLLLEKYGPPCLGQRRESALVFLACWASSLPLVQILFSRYPDLDPNSRSKCPMFRCSSDHNPPRFTTWMGIAANRGNVPLVQFLLDRGGDPSLALSAAAAGGSVRCLELLVKTGATWERKMKGRWSLHPLAAAGLGGQYPEAISFLLENGFSPMDDPTGRFVTTDKLSDEERKHRSSMYNTAVAHDHRPWHRPCNACIAEVLIPCGYDFRTTYDWALRVVPYNP